MNYPTASLVRAGLNGPNGEVLRIIALQPRRHTAHMPKDPPLVPVPGR